MGEAKNKRTLWNLFFHPDPWKVESPFLAIFLVLAVVLCSGLEAAYVQVVTTHRAVTWDLWRDLSFLYLACLDLLLPLTVALLSKWAFIVYLTAQCFLSVILLHYTIFFYNTLTLSTIYHSMQGAASLGIDIFGFARWDIIIPLGLFLAVKLFVVQISMAKRKMPKIFNLRGLAAVGCMCVITWLVMLIYGKTGLSQLWVESRGHRPAAERRLEEGARESVRSIGYLATWLGEFLSGAYKDTALIYAEVRCPSPDGGACLKAAEEGRERHWLGLPAPEFSAPLVMIQAESLDFAALDMRVNGRTVTPFLNHLARHSLVLRVFAPHKVGSCNSDYELLNGRVAEQNVIYYTYIKQYPDSVVHLLRRRGLEPAFLHGLPGSLFNLREAYGLQGFTEFHFKEELLARGYPASSLIMNHVLDEHVFDQAARRLAEGAQAQFIVTMSSHVPFLKAWPEYKSAGGNFARYVSSLTYLDRCLAGFYQSLPDGAVLIVWGDHGSDVPYPRGFGPGTRHVPFLVHVKGREAWLAGRIGAASPETWDLPLAADGREYTLCELSHYLRCFLYP